MKIKPFQISIFLFFVLSALLGLTFLSQHEGIQKNQVKEDGFSYDGAVVKYPTYRTFFELDIDSITKRTDFVKLTNAVIPLDDIGLEAQETPKGAEIEGTTAAATDTIPVPVNNIKSPNLDFSKIDTIRVTRIQYPPGVPDFTEKLQEKLRSGACRILHYGDSQLEGDRITGYLRNRLQSMYGGSGPGFIPVKPVYNQISAIVEPSENWIRYARFDPTKDKFAHKKYGLYMSVSRFTPAQKAELDSLSLQLVPVTTASVTIGKSSKTYTNFRKFTKIGLHYGNCRYPVVVSVFNNEKKIQQDSLITDGNYHEYKIRTDKTPENLRIELEGKISPDFYGLTLDGKGSVQIDNVAMRGASGTIFSSTDRDNYSQMARRLKPKIVIMQYGGNTMPYLKDSTEVLNYSKYVINQAKWIRRRTKDVQFLFIGPTDMCIPINGKMTTYPLLPYLNAQLAKRALENGIAYWSMFDAMGGKGAMEYWVEEKLAGNDYTHFTHKGTKIISELLFTALYLDLTKVLADET